MTQLEKLWNEVHAMHQKLTAEKNPVKRMALMDTRGPDWCEDNIDTIAGWLREEAKHRKMPFIRYAAVKIIRRAIRKARSQ